MVVTLNVMSSFRKRNVPKPLPGTRTSAQTGQVITSSGNPSLDLILGGGLPIGSICIIEEDKFVTYSKVLARYFLAEGVLWHQSIFLGSLDDSPKNFLRKLPSPLNEQELDEEKAELEAEGVPKNGLRIAWRYENLPLVNSEQATARIGHHFNLLKYMDPFFLDLTETVTWCARNLNAEEAINEQIEDHDSSVEEQIGISPIKLLPSGMINSLRFNDGISMQTLHTELISRSIDNLNTISINNMEMDAPKSEENTSSEESTSASNDAVAVAAEKPKIFNNIKFERLWTELHALLLKQRFNATATLDKSLCRVCITSLGSPLWFDEHFSQDLLKFLTILRATVRNQTSVCFITMPMSLIAKYDPTLVPKIRNLVDYAIELESFAGSERETHQAFKEYNGLLHIHKMSAINTLTTYMPETYDLAFKLRRKKFVIEKLHLPPELQEENSDETIPSLSCSAASSSANPKASLDF